MKIYIDIETRRIAADDPRLATLVAEAVEDIRAPKNYGKDAAEKYVAEKSAEAAANARDRTAFNPMYGTVAVIGYAAEDDIVRSFAHDNELDLLIDFFREITAYTDLHPVFVGHNVMFDLRFLLGRAIILGVKPPKFFIDAARGKSWDKTVIDTMLLWSGDAQVRVSLDKICAALHIPSPKDGFSGKDVSPALEAGELAKVVKYNMGDVLACRAIYKRMMFE